ncbi:MAG TPA: Fe2+-dependent dioxygenase [Stellaceae bacterium]|nr:Fe2+-dependent dioxygenase [Stellaceae bacterium]
MILHIAGVLSAIETAALTELISDASLFTDGRGTAGWRARERKSNLQADADAPLVAGALRKIETALTEHEVFQAAARPKSIVGLLLSRYEPGMGYGTHVDEALIADQRTDLAFTLFLCTPNSYGGGELVIARTEGDRGFKLPAGDLLLYPATTLHRVAPVTRGVRLAAVGWVRSLVRDAGQRELLFDLDQAIELLRGGSDAERALDLVLKARGNLLRRWIED